MKIRRITLLGVISLALLQTCFSQNFVNLDFEDANVSGYTPGSGVPIADAFPGWSASYSSGSLTNMYSFVGYDLISLGGFAVSINDTNSFNLGVIQGNYSAYLFGSGVGADATSVTISQTGLVPNGTESLTLDAELRLGSTQFIVTLGGQTINMVPLQTYSTYTLYGGDISSFAGHTATLSITEPPLPPVDRTEPSLLIVDNICFSPSAVPEPSYLPLVSIGFTIPFCFFRRRNS
jgi:hypothetical protein